MRPMFAVALVVPLSVLSPGPRAQADTVHNAITANALTNNAITANALTNNALSGNAVASQPAGTAVSDLNGVGVEGVVLPARRR